MTKPAAPLLLALFEPDIAQNTGAMMRTCACLGVDAAIIEPAGFRINDSRFRRAAMDYVDALAIESHNSWAGFAAWRADNQRRLVLLTTKGETCLWDFAFREKDIILVGRESSGVPEAVRVSADVRVYIPHSTSPAFFERRDRRNYRDDRGVASAWTLALQERRT